MFQTLSSPRRQPELNAAVSTSSSPLKFRITSKNGLKLLFCLAFIYSFIDVSNDEEVPIGFSRSLQSGNDESQGEDRRENAVQAMMKTPGWKVASNGDGTKTLNVNDMYIFAPREEYENLREKYEKDPASMPSPYHNMLPPSTISSLNLPTLQSRHSYINPYDASQVIKTLKYFFALGFILFYSGETDTFSVYLPESETVNESVQIHAQKIDQTLVRILKADYPDRFQKGQPDFSVVLSAGDSPKIDCSCVLLPNSREDKLPLSEELIMEKLSNEEFVCNRFDFSAIWNFASGYVNPEAIPSAITFPPWGYHHFGCFETYRFENKVCNDFLEKSEANPNGRLNFGEHYMVDDIARAEFTIESENPLNSDGWIDHKASHRRLQKTHKKAAKKTARTPPRELEEEKKKKRDSDISNGSSTTHRQTEVVKTSVWDYLKPQVMWRGSDFCFLPCVQKGKYHYNLKPEDIPGENTPEGFVKGLHEIWFLLTPRWKAVTMSLEAELEASKINESMDLVDGNNGSWAATVPWIDAKFTDKHRGPEETENWHHFQELGARVVSEHMDWKEASAYKYHTDFGGGGGTTWLGVESKLALPGVLFHHETQAYDWFHEDLIPFVHYIPISIELDDVSRTILTFFDLFLLLLAFSCLKDLVFAISYVINMNGQNHIKKSRRPFPRRERSS